MTLMHTPPLPPEAGGLIGGGGGRSGQRGGAAAAAEVGADPHPRRLPGSIQVSMGAQTRRMGAGGGSMGALDGCKGPVGVWTPRMDGVGRGLRMLGSPGWVQGGWYQWVLSSPGWVQGCLWMPGCPRWVRRGVIHGCSDTWDGCRESADAQDGCRGRLWVPECLGPHPPTHTLPLPRWPPGMSKRQSLSTFSSENFSDGDGDGDGDEGHTSEPSHSATPDVGSTNTDERPDDRSEDLLSQGSEIPLDAAPPEGPGRRQGGLSPKVMPPPQGGCWGAPTAPPGMGDTMGWDPPSMGWGVPRVSQGWYYGVGVLKVLEDRASKGMEVSQGPPRDRYRRIGVPGVPPELGIME